ncbi:murinoglobulin-2-like [Discoglossus pictus]
MTLHFIGHIFIEAHNKTTVQYNIPVPKENSAFSLSVSSSPKSCVNGVAHSFDLNASISYQGTRNETNMVIIEIKMLSGYSADYWSLRELVNSKKVSKTEEQNGRVILYMNSVSRETTQLTFKVQMGNRVLNVKEASAKCYDYYQAEENAAATYRHPCAVQA